MPIKCMLQIPSPMAIGPQSHHHPEGVRAGLSRPVRSSATYDAIIAMAIEVATNQASKCAVIGCWQPGHLSIGFAMDGACPVLHSAAARFGSG
jgi:hypothetical protein